MNLFHLSAALGLLLAGAAAQKPTDEAVAEGRTAFRSKCVQCHFVPDLTIPRDQLWVDLIQTTA